MRKVVILKNIKGSPNGKTVVEYKKDSIVSIPDSLYKCFIQANACVDYKKPEKKVEKTEYKKKVLTTNYRKKSK